MKPLQRKVIEAVARRSQMEIENYLWVFQAYLPLEFASATVRLVRERWIPAEPWQRGVVYEGGEPYIIASRVLEHVHVAGRYVGMMGDAFYVVGFNRESRVGVLWM